MQTTQAARLVDVLKGEGFSVASKRFPDRTTATGKVIDSYLQCKSELDDHVIHLLYSANRWEAKADIEALLASGVSLVVDRYSFSGKTKSAFFLLVFLF